MASFVEANRLYNEGRYQEALNQYLELKEVFGGQIVEFSIKRCQEKIGCYVDTSETYQNKFISTITSNIDCDETLIGDIIKNSDGWLNNLPNLKEEPLVSVVMTSHNSEKYIESAVYSLLDQSYNNLEIIIVDDFSSDNTISILTRLSKSYKNIRFFRLNSNLGTYYAKNLGITKSRGQIIFFHDSDDICHQYRIEISVKCLLNNDSAVAVRTAYARINPENGTVVKVDNHQYKLGLITLGIKRTVFDKIGFFNCTTKASDDEFFNRIKSYFKKSSIIDVNYPLYFNTMRKNSLISDMIDWKGESEIKQMPSVSRADYVKTFTDIHKNSTIRFAGRFVFPTIRDILPVDSSMTRLSNPEIPVYINLCSIPERESKLKNVIKSIYNQCDYIHVYLDRYTTIPNFLKDDKITVICSYGKSNSLRDNGKFILLEELAKNGKNGYYFTIDDDIDYPLDYVNTLIKKINYYDNKVVVGTHGVLLPRKIDSYFSRYRKVFSFYRELGCDKLVHLLGTGTTAFRIDLFQDFKLSNFTHTGMADVFFAIECQKRKIPQIAISRFDNWISEMSKDTPALFSEFKHDDSIQTNLIKEYNIGGDDFFEFSNLPESLIEKLPKLPTLGFYRA